MVVPDARSPRVGKGRLAQRTRRLATRLEPLVDAGRVELVLTRDAGELRQRAGGGFDNGVADGALLDTYRATRVLGAGRPSSLAGARRAPPRLQTRDRRSP